MTQYKPARFLLLSLFFCLLKGIPLDYVADWPQMIIKETNFHELQKEGPFRTKAMEYDDWNAKYHHPYYGGLVRAIFRDTSYKEVVQYDVTKDSCIWTGIYLGSQAFRYGVTRDPKARENIIKNVKALDGYLHVTGRKGFIARYHAPQKSLVYKGDEWCAQIGHCHKITTGKYSGDFYQGDTSKDQYSGWFFGMSLAYDFIDNEEIKGMIRNDITEIMDRLIKDNWIIRDENRKYHLISAGQRPTYIYQLSWLTIAYHVSGNKVYKDEVKKRLTSINFMNARIVSYAGYFNKYNQYYGNNLAHITWYNLLRLGKVYYSNDAYKTLRNMFTSKVHVVGKLSHNPWFNTIFMSQGGYHPSPVNDKYKQQLLEDINAFRRAPNFSYYRPSKNLSKYKLDPVTSWIRYFPKLQELLETFKIGIRPQALNAFPINEQCFAGFMFQQSPYKMEECGYDNNLIVESGHDYLAAYWMASYHGFISKDQ